MLLSFLVCEFELSYIYLLLKSHACRLDFKLYSSLLQCSGCVQSKNGVDLVEVSIFYVEEDERQSIWPIKIKIVALFYLIMAALSSDFFFVVFTMLWTYTVQKKSLR